MSGAADPIFGKLNWTVTPYTDLLREVTSSTIVGAGAASVLVLCAIAGVALLTWMRWWGPLYRNWLTSADAKKIGIMYIVLALILMARGISEGFVIRTHQSCLGRIDHSAHRRPGLVLGLLFDIGQSLA